LSEAFTSQKSSVMSYLRIVKTMLVSVGVLLVSNYGYCRDGIIRATNLLSVPKADELIVISRNAIEKKTGKIPKGKYAIIEPQRKQPVVVQYDDLNGDGVWDELAFLYSFKAKEKAIFSVSVSNAPATVKAVVRAHVRHKRKNADDSFGNDLSIDSIPVGQPGADFSQVALPPFLTEGPAWENDKVGFRLYFDVRNGKDIWGKTTPRMMMDEVGLDTAYNYHKQAEWGMDILKVGKSLGAGSLALQVPQPIGKDSLIRLAGVNMGKVIYKKIADGPVRAILRLYYPAWKVLDNADPVSLTEEISIWGGQYFYESKVTVNHTPENSKLVTGIVNLHSKSSYQIQAGNQSILYTHDLQTENNDRLGMAVMIAKNILHEVGKAPNENSDILNTYTATMKVANSQPVKFRFYACWEKSEKMFKTKETFRKYLVNEAALLSNPIRVNVE
jgi:hypothetical protein